jgi:hypothetical protein
MVMVTVPSTVGMVGTPHGAVLEGNRQVEEVDEFFAVVCSDAELLRAEFEAIVEAAWSSAPPPDPSPRRRAEPPPGGAVADPPLASGPVGPNLVTGVRDGGARTRSPPTSPGRCL